jgi:hypothetical protein
MSGRVAAAAVRKQHSKIANCRHDMRRGIKGRAIAPAVFLLPKNRF